MEAGYARALEAARNGTLVFCASGLVAQEIFGAPHDVQKLFESTFDRSTDLLAFTDEMEELAREYVKAGVVSPKFEDDARHVAICTIHRIDHLVSWNFQHLVNVRREAGFNAVNLLQGLPSISIVSPKELIYGNSDDQDF